MWGNFISQPVNLKMPYDISLKSTDSTVEIKTCDKQINIERELCLESDTDFQSFLLPLEQDFTKSSKGYASLLASTPVKEMRSVDLKNKFEESKMNMWSSENFSKDTKDSCDKLLLNNSLHVSNADNLHYGKCTQIIRDTLENIQCDQIDENIFSKKKEIVYLEKSVKISYDFSENLPSPNRFNDKSDDDDNSESSETDSIYSGCNNSLNSDGNSSSDDSIIFSEDLEDNKNWYSTSTFKIKKTSVSTIDSDNSESSDINHDCFKEAEEDSSEILSSDFTFEFGTVNLLKNTMVSQMNSYDSITPLKSGGYINACFEYDDCLTEKSTILRSINKSWNDSMKNISEEPHESKRVSFVPLPHLVSIYSYEPEADNYQYSLHVLDQLRFQNRIKDFESVIAPYLTSEHRINIYKRNYPQD